MTEGSPTRWRWGDTVTGDDDSRVGSVARDWTAPSLAARDGPLCDCWQAPVALLVGRRRVPA